MRTLAITQNMTVDGSVELLGDWFTPQPRPGVDLSDHLEELHRQDVTLCHALIEAALVDEFRLFVYPVVQGRGRRLFPEGYHDENLRTQDVRTFRDGVTLLRFRAGSGG